MRYEFRDTVRFSEVDESGYLTLTALVNYFQDTAIFQSEKGGIGFDYLKPKNQAWLLASWQIEIDHMPVLCDEITVATWTYEFKAFYGYRNFVLYDAQGNKAAWANSVWFLCDTKYQMPVKIDERSLAVYGTEPRIEMEYLPRKIALPGLGITENGSTEGKAQEAFGTEGKTQEAFGTEGKTQEAFGTEGKTQEAFSTEGKIQEAFKIERHHLDTNHHVNNGQYIDMAVQYLPQDAQVTRVRAEYKMQAHLGDEMVPVVFEDGKLWTIALNNREGKAYAVVQLTIK